MATHVLMCWLTGQLSKLYPGDMSRLAWYAATVRDIQMRAVAILLSVAASGPDYQRRPKHRFPRLLSDAHAVGSEHSLIPLGDMWFCSVCMHGRHSTEPGLVAWFRSECKPGEDFPHTAIIGHNRPCPVPVGTTVRAGRHVLHDSHRFVAFKGLVYCEKCGCYATEAPKLLKVKCAGVPRGTSIPVLWRLRRGLLPHGLPGWPNEVRDVEGFVDL